MRIERTTTRLVKPSTLSHGTPHLVSLSSIDLAIARIHVEVLYAYNAPVIPTPSLEKGLSKVLVHYREWAGRLSKDASGRPAIELNDEGVVLIEAQAHGNLQDLWPFNPSDLLLDLIPINRSGVPELLLIQVTRFACGGMTLGVARQHRVADGEAASEFMEAWAAAVKGLPIAIVPLHDRSALMARDPPPSGAVFEYQEPPPTPEGKATTDHPDLAIKKLHFSAELLKKIKADVAKEGASYSTFVSLLAHLWKCITKAKGLEDEEGETRAAVAVNVRKRISPPLPQGYFGNAICFTCPQTKMKDLVSKPLSFAAAHVHDAIQKVNSNYVRSALDFIELQQRNAVVQPVDADNTTMLTPNLIVTSWTRLPLYSLDFGRGTPTFAGPPSLPFEDLLTFAPSHKKDGSIDVVLGLFTPHMDRLEAICFDLNGCI